MGWEITDLLDRLRIWIGLVAVVGCTMSTAQNTHGQNGIVPSAQAESVASNPLGGVQPRFEVDLSPDQSRQAIQWMALQWIRHSPATIDGDSHWGDTKSVWAGVKLTRDGLKLSTKRRWRELRHGRWIRYEIRLPTMPSTSDRLVVADTPISIHELSPVVGERDELVGWSVDGELQTPAKFDVRVERWNLGVQWYSVNITGDMTLRLRCRGKFAVQADYAEIPPAVALKATIADAKLDVPYFEVQRISKIGGDVAEEIGELAEDTILKLWLRRENKKLADRLNRGIEKNQDDLRFSWLDWLAKWNQ
ncbi:MAG: hypothetical protein AAF670_20850 [Planctomycetota bacterium]